MGEAQIFTFTLIAAVFGVAVVNFLLGVLLGKRLTRTLKPPQHVRVVPIAMAERIAHLEREQLRLQNRQREVMKAFAHVRRILRETENLVSADFTVPELEDGSPGKRAEEGTPPGRNSSRSA